MNFASALNSGIIPFCCSSEPSVGNHRTGNGLQQDASSGAIFSVRRTGFRRAIHHVCFNSAASTHDWSFKAADNSPPSSFQITRSTRALQPPVAVRQNERRTSSMCVGSAYAQDNRQISGNGAPQPRLIPAILKKNARIGPQRCIGINHAAGKCPYNWALSVVLICRNNTWLCVHAR